MSTPDTSTLPDYAPVPPSAHGPAVNERRPVELGDPAAGLLDDDL